MANKTFRLFISSPFSDFTKEREVLHKKVFPTIEKHCNDNNLTFQPVDLRWGVNEEAQLDQKTLEVCLEEVRACKHFPHPNFLIMAGDRYGYVPCPYMIEESEFEDIYNYVKDNNGDLEIEYWEHKKEKYPKVYGEDAEGKETALNRKTNYIELLEQWYKLDENQLPASYILQERTDKNPYGNYLIYENWGPEENSLRDILQEAANHIFKSEQDKENKEYQKYFLSATEQEVLEGIFDYKYKTDSQKDCDGKVDKEYIFGYTRSIEKIDDSEDNQIFLDRLKKKQVAELKAKADGFKEDLHKLLTDNVFPSNFTSVKEYKANELIEFEEYITDKIIDSINTQIPEKKELSTQEQKRLNLEEEKSEQEKFLKDKVKGFQGRDTTLKAIKKYLKEHTTEPFIIHGPSGMGKSSLMAKAIESAKTDSTIFRFVGATANSTTIRNLLISIVDELQEKNIIEQIDEYELDENKFETQIKDILLSIEEKTMTTVTIFIDALDQLQYQEYLNWLPDELNYNLKIILSVLDDPNPKYKEDRHYYEVLSRRYHNNKSFIDITKDSLEEKKEALIKDLLEDEHRKLNPVQIDYLLEQWASTEYSPLYLKIAIEEVKHWKHCEDENRKPMRCDKQKLNKGIDGEGGIISEYLRNLEELYHHEELLIKKVFGYIHASKDGLSEKELLQMLSEDLEDEEEFQTAIINEYHEPIKVKNPRRGNKEELILPMSIWSRLHTLIKPFIIERNIDGQPLMKFFHRQFTSVVEELYTEDEKEKLHTNLADYFLTLQDTTKTWDKRYNNPHMLDEIPYQLYHAGDSKRLKKILFDLEFAGSIYDHHKQVGFREIMEKAIELKGISKDEIHPWESFYREKEHLITKVDAKMWRPHQSLFQLAYEDGNNSPLSQEAERLLENDRVDFLWMKKKNRSETYRRSGLLKVLHGHTLMVHGVKILDDGRIFSYSSDSFRLWSDEGEPLAVIKGHTEEIREVEILSDGSILSYLKGKTLWLLSSEGEPLAELEGHTRYIEGVVDDNKILSYSWGAETTLRLWSSEGEELAVLEGHTSSINGAKILDDGRIISYAAAELRLWSSEGVELAEFKGHTLRIMGAEILDDGSILTYANDNTLRLWSSEGAELAEFKGHTEGINGAKILNDGSILSYANDNTLRLWNCEGAELALFKGHTDRITAAKVLEDGRILSYSDDETLRLWSSKGEELAVIKGHTEGINAAKILDDGRILTYSDDNTLRLWSSEGVQLAEFKGHTGSIDGAEILDDGRILSYADDNTLRLWSSEGEELAELEGHTSYITGVEILDDGRILSYSWDGTLRFWSSEGAELAELEGHSDQIKSAKILDDGRILSRSWDSLRLWNCEGEELAEFKGHTDGINVAEILDDGRILTYANDNTLRLWSSEGEELAEFKGHTDGIDGAKVLEDGRVLSYSWDETLRLWSSEGKPLVVLKGHIGGITGAKVLEDGRILVYFDSFLVLWSSKGKLLAVFKGHTEGIKGAEILDDDRILSYSWDNTLRLWNCEGEELAVFKGHTEGINAAEILDDGRILSYADDNTLRLWNSEGEELAELEGHTGYITGVDILDDGRILSYSRDFTLRLWSSGGVLLSVQYLASEDTSFSNIKQETILATNGKYLLLYDFYDGSKVTTLEDIAQKSEALLYEDGI